MRNPFCDHPASVGESYFEHLFAAAMFGVRMIAGGFACIIHALLPFLFVRTGSETVRSLNGEMMARRRGGDQPMPNGPLHGLEP